MQLHTAGHYSEFIAEASLAPAAPYYSQELFFVFTDIHGFTFNNRVLRLPAIVFLNTTFRPGNSGLLRV